MIFDFVDVGNGSAITGARIVALLDARQRGVRVLREKYGEAGRVIHLLKGRKGARTAVILDTGYMIISALTVYEILKRGTDCKEAIAALRPERLPPATKGL